MRLGLAVAVVVAVALAAAGLAGSGGGRPARRVTPSRPGGASPSPSAAASARPSERTAPDIARRRSIAVLRRKAPISAYGGYVAWSTRRRGRWSLMQWHAGRVNPVPVAPSERPFDVDLGPDERGRPTAVYSRCRGLCRIYRVALDGGGRERALGALTAGGAASESHPSIWRRRLAFVARRPGADAPTVYVARSGASRPVAVRGGSRPQCTGQGGDCAARVTGLDLGARVLAFVWEIDASNPDNGIGPEWEVRLHRVAGAPFVVARDLVVGDGFISGGCGSIVPESPNAAGSGVVYLQQLNNCEATAGGTHSLFVNAAGARRPDRRVEPFPVRFPVGEAFGLAYDRGTAYWLYGTSEDSTRFDAPCVPDGCPLVASPLLPFANVPDPDPLRESGEG